MKYYVRLDSVITAPANIGIWYDTKRSLTETILSMVSSGLLYQQS